MRRGTLVRLVLLLLVVGIAVAGAGLGWTWMALERPHAGWQGESVEVVLEPGVDAGRALRRLAAAGVIRHPRFARGWIMPVSIASTPRSPSWRCWSDSSGERWFSIR